MPSKKIFLAIVSFFLIFNSCKKSAPVSPKTLSLLQNRWLLSSGTMYSTDPLPSTIFPGIYYKYVGTPTDSYTFNANGLVDISMYNLNSSLQYSLSNDTTMNYAAYLSFTWSNRDNPIIIKAMTENLLVLSYPVYGHFTNNTGLSIDYKGVRIDSLTK